MTPISQSKEDIALVEKQLAPLRDTRNYYLDCKPVIDNLIREYGDDTVRAAFDLLNNETQPSFDALNRYSKEKPYFDCFRRID
jgi:hypothetical protein